MISLLFEVIPGVFFLGALASEGYSFAKPRWEALKRGDAPFYPEGYSKKSDHFLLKEGEGSGVLGNWLWCLREYQSNFPNLGGAISPSTELPKEGIEMFLVKPEVDLVGHIKAIWDAIIPEEPETAKMWPNAYRALLAILHNASRR